jgi:beta-glucosidase
VIAAMLFFNSAHAQTSPLSAPAQNNQPQESTKPPYLDPNLPIDQRVTDLVSRMTLEEKVSQMQDVAPAIPRLGIPAYNWWNEALHGVARAGNATVFPQAIGLAATWDPDLIHRVAGVISTEARAKYNDALAHGNTSRYFGLTFFSPNINIFRDPRWGRGQETYGEDPFLTSRIGVAFVTGMQGDDPHYLKTISTPKHFAVHSGPESNRHSFDVPVTPHDFADTYAPAFRALITEGKADSVMCAYNSVLGLPACASPFLLDTLRNSWGFRGYVVSDCGAVYDISHGHHFSANIKQASAISLKAGTDLTCGNDYATLVAAVNDGLVSVDDIDRSVKRLFEARFRLGMFDSPDLVPWSNLTLADNDTPEHRALALQAARESIVLLKNDGNILPLTNSPKTIAVIGPTADSLDVLLGNYNGTPSRFTTILAGIRKRFGSSKVVFSPGSALTEVNANPNSQSGLPGDAPPANLLTEAASLAKSADIVIAVVGITPGLEGEEMKTSAAGFSGGDRTSLDLPAPQQKLIEALAATGKPLIVVLTNGSALGVNWAQKNAAAILDAWYPGEEGGAAVADVLSGDYNPSGRLPVTFYTGIDQLPPFENYSMAGRTYRYFSGTPLYPFGFGLSFTKFAYTNARVDREKIAANEEVNISVDVKNTGAVEGDEVVQLYVAHPDVSGAPIRALAGFMRVHLAAGEQRSVSIPLCDRQFSIVDENGKRRILAGLIEVSIGGGQPTVGVDQTLPAVAKTKFRITTQMDLPD